MTPKEYESYVAEYFQKKGYRVELTSYSNDCGIDIFAFKENKKVGIQVKMYGHTTRKVNRQMIMELHGAKDFFNCTKAVLVTDGQVMDSAEQAAAQLCIDILVLKHQESKSVEVKDPFDHLWSTYIKPLEGTTIVSKKGLKNHIVNVDWGGVDRITSNGRRQHIKIEIFRLAIQKLLSEGEITRDCINQEYKGRASSGIVLLLSHIPFFKFHQNPSRLVLDKKKLPKFFCRRRRIRSVRRYCRSYSVTPQGCRGDRAGNKSHGFPLARE